MSATRTGRAPASGLRTAALMSVAGGLLAALHMVGRGSLPPPPLTTPAHLSEWVEQHGAAVAAMSLLRCVAVAAGWYTLAAAALHLLAAATRSNPLDSLARCITVRPLRRLLVAAGAGVTATALGAATAPLSLAAGSRLPQAASAAQQVTVPIAGPDTFAPHTGTPTSIGQAPPPTTTPGSAASVRRIRPGAPGTASLRRIRPGPTVDGAAQAPAPTAVPGTHSPAINTAQPPGHALTWTVKPGDNFWTIAANVVRTGWGHEPSDSEVYRYWRLLIDANRPRLLRQGDPNLIFAGQLFVLPPLPPPDQPR